ncbi:thyroid adenoma-associated protein homolog [Macrosteles quadrilineatus]|uniref:thyroid adenoma-associated protein homolog n=1 Tax=Macrosteles quadrilineatus TaxID=74068 RepID=UPI0023E2BF8F|nr:thyroid adenoma-associated protein homolog [Macrosteles quadrilineatus]XP_054263911.1 thyroid adenoma-associated protein homolog [Macrosteles quadrilineatus]
MSVTLSLRVTSDKRKPGTKVPNTKEENLIPVIKYLKRNTQHGTGSYKFLQELEEASDLKAQLQTLKDALKSLNTQSENDQQEKIYFHIIVDILLNLELKSPLRSGIIRILKEYKETKSAIVVDVISEWFTAKFQSCEQDILSILKTANAVCGCFDNFPTGAEAVGKCAKDVLTFIFNSLLLCKNILGLEGSSVQSTDVCQCIHTLVRAGLHVVSLQLSADFDKSQLHQLSKQLMACDLPLDTRTNCGLLAVTTGRQEWYSILQDQLKSEDDLTSLCLYSGIIGCLPKEDLTSTGDLFGGISPVQLIFNHIINIHKRNPLQPTVTLSVARTLVSLSRVLVACDSQQLIDMLPRLLSYTWEHLEHVMDSVKHLAVALLNNIVKLHSPEVDVYSNMLSAMKHLPAWSRARHVALSALLGKVPVSQLISNGCEIQLMYEHLSKEVVSSHAVNAFQEFMRHHYNEVSDKDEWTQLWIKPLLQRLDQNPSVPLQQVLGKALAISDNLVQYILKLPEGQVSLGTTLLCLCLSHKTGFLDTSGADDDMWRGVVSYDTLRSAINHTDDQTRLSCLSLIVEAPKSSEVFTTNELRLVTEYVSYNLHWECPAARQRNIALLNKFVKRFNDSHQALQRRSDTSGQLLSYSQCYQQLQDVCVDSLFPGATHSRRVSALHLLLSLRPQATPLLQAALLACLADSYEDVKAMAVRLLTNTPGLLEEFKEPSTVLNVIRKGLQYAGGVKPPESLSAAYLLTTLSHTPLSDAAWAAILDKYPFCNHNVIEYKGVYYLVMIVADELTRQLAVAEENLLKAASSAPLHGLLFTIRLMLTQADLKSCNSEMWRQLIRRLVELSFSCSAAVASVVNSDSPEGHLPMDFDFDPSDVCGGEQEGVEGVTSQMVLLCSWRTVKEVSLLLGHLAEECSIATTPQEAGLLEEKDILRIGNHLTTLLAETKHRGAFEQAYVGFCKLVSRLWRLPMGTLQQLPLKWLKDTMDEISNNEETLCATRRSAGIPFMIQALICTQMEVQGPLSVEGWVSCLLALAECASAPPTTHTHALNILRALFRSTQLGEAVSVCVERAFIVTISAFSASNWMERNSATLLLSALMTRVFGVPRSKSQDSLSWKNKMTGRIFFQRYPKLFDFFQLELQKASQSGSKLHPSLYPVLLILGRLYPSSLEGTDSNVQLTQYIPDIVVCSGSNIYKTRTLAARAMVALMSLSHFDNVIQQVTRPDISTNFRHGLHLQVAFFLKQSDLKVNHLFFKDQIETWIEKLIGLFDKKLSVPELQALVNIFNIFYDKYSLLVPQTVWVQIREKSKSLLNPIPSSELLGSCLLRPALCELLLKLAMRSEKDIVSLCCQLLNDNIYEVRHTVLDFISCLCGYSCSESFGEFYKLVDFNTKQSCRYLLLHDHEIIKVIAEKALNVFENKGDHPDDNVRLLSVLRGWEEVWVEISDKCKEDLLAKLLDLCRDSYNEIATCALFCVNDFLKSKKHLNEGDITSISTLLEELTSSETSYLYHEPLHELVVKNFSALQMSTQAVNRLQMYKTLIQLSDHSHWTQVVDQVTRTEKNAVVTATLVLGLTLGQFTGLRHNQDNVAKVFDTEEVSSDYEEYILSRICSQKFNELCDSTLKIQLDKPLRDWLTKETGLDGSTLAEFVSLARMQVLQLDSSDPCQFLYPGYQRLRLNWLKLKNIL